MNRTVVEYTALLTRAFNGAVEVDGTRIVAHPSGTLIARAPRGTEPPPVRGSQVAMTAADPDNDWTNV